MDRSLVYLATSALLVILVAMVLPDGTMEAVDIAQEHGTGALLSAANFADIDEIPIKSTVISTENESSQDNYWSNPAYKDWGLSIVAFNDSVVQRMDITLPNELFVQWICIKGNPYECGETLVLTESSDFLPDRHFHVLSEAFPYAFGGESDVRDIQGPKYGGTMTIRVDEFKNRTEVVIPHFGLKVVCPMNSSYAHFVATNGNPISVTTWNVYSGPEDYVKMTSSQIALLVHRC